MKNEGGSMIEKPNVKISHAELFFASADTYTKGVNFCEDNIDALSVAYYRLISLVEPDWRQHVPAPSVRKYIEHMLGRENVRGRVRVWRRQGSILLWCKDKDIFITLWRLFTLQGDQECMFGVNT
jgi:hypothetical protein